MSTEKTAKKEESKTQVKSGGFSKSSLLFKVVLSIIAVSLIVISQYIFVFCIFGMLPSITAILIDKQINKFASSTVTAFNMIAIMPFLDKIWRSAQYTYTARAMLSDINVWFMIFGVTSIGWFLIVIVPHITARLFVLRATNKIKRLEKRLSDLKDEWTYSL